MEKKESFRSRLKQWNRSENGDIIQSILFIAVLLFSSLMVGSVIYKASSEKKKEFAEALNGSPTPTATPKPEAVSPEIVQDTASNFPLGSIVLVLLGLVLLGTLIAGVVMLSKKASTAKVITSSNLAGWQALVDHHAKIRSEWMAYETDILKIVDFPLLSDMSEPVTIKLHEALRNAVMHEPKNVNAMRNIPFETSSYNTAVTELDTAFRAAESKARLSSWNKFTMEEKKRLQRAKDLLALALNGASTPSERQAAYKQAIKSLQGLIEVPKATILALESNTQLALTA